MNTQIPLLLLALFVSHNNCHAAEKIAQCAHYHNPTKHELEIKYTDSTILEFTYFMARPTADYSTTYNCSINARRGDLESRWVDPDKGGGTEINITDIGKIKAEIQTRVIKFNFENIKPTVCGNTGPATKIIINRASGRCKFIFTH